MLEVTSGGISFKCFPFEPSVGDSAKWQWSSASVRIVLLRWLLARKLPPRQAMEPPGGTTRQFLEPKGSNVPVLRFGFVCGELEDAQSGVPVVPLVLVSFCF